MRADGELNDADLEPVTWSAALALPGVEQSQPFGPDFEVFKVGGKVCAMTKVLRGTPIVTFKCEPEHGLALQQEFGTVTPSYQMNKRHWTSIAAAGGSRRGARRDGRPVGGRSAPHQRTEARP